MSKIRPLHHHDPGRRILYRAGMHPVYPLLQHGVAEMSLNCTRCEASGFLNLHQVDDETLSKYYNGGMTDVILKWIAENVNHDVSVCDCCGNGEDWYGLPGEHYNSEDPAGPNGPYASNGGLCKCH